MSWPFLYKNMIIKSTKDVFLTSDLVLTSVISLWYPLDLIDKSNPKKAQFQFKENPDWMNWWNLTGVAT